MIRQATMEDVRSILTLWRTCGLIEDEQCVEKILREKITLTPHFVLVWQKKAGIIGAVVGSYDPFDTYVRLLGVDPAFRQRGIGTALIVAMVERLKARGAKEVCGFVYQSNTESPPLLEKLGWERLEDCRFYAKTFEK